MNEASPSSRRTASTPGSAEGTCQDTAGVSGCPDPSTTSIVARWPEQARPTTFAPPPGQADTADRRASMATSRQASAENRPVSEAGPGACFRATPTHRPPGVNTPALIQVLPRSRDAT
ncbi:MAG: hypothetical protein CVU65_01140 [Deltaproteobacteria bacterium HGW-Deltaproteobacteria-22]|nr:MAG: hypothetical protein CVU65_01140 [Deltaproteobacteria bacterium HGW-Deltaproteobacteria-22]